jgi:hypothetical protein
MFAARQRRMVPDHQKVSYVAREPSREQESRRRGVGSGVRGYRAGAGPRGSVPERESFRSQDRPLV